MYGIDMNPNSKHQVSPFAEGAVDQISDKVHLRKSPIKKTPRGNTRNHVIMIFWKCFQQCAIHKCFHAHATINDIHYSRGPRLLKWSNQPNLFYDMV